MLLLKPFTEDQGWSMLQSFDFASYTYFH